LILLANEKLSIVDMIGHFDGAQEDLTGRNRSSGENGMMDVLWKSGDWMFGVVA